MFPLVLLVVELHQFLKLLFLRLEHDDNNHNAEHDTDTIEHEVPSFYNQPIFTFTVANIVIRIGSKLLLIVFNLIDNGGDKYG